MLSRLRKDLPIGQHHFQVFFPVSDVPYIDSAITHFCTNIDRAFFKKYPSTARLKIDGVLIGTIDEAFEPSPPDRTSDWKDRITAQDQEILNSLKPNTLSES